MMQKKIFNISILLLLLINISFFKLLFNTTYFGWLKNIIYLITLPILLNTSYKNKDKFHWIYIGIMILGLVFHTFLPEIKEITLSDSLQWIFIIAIIINFNKFKINSNVFLLVLILFFITNCFLAIYEVYLQTNIFDFKHVEGFSYYTDKYEFRAFALMEHPLQSANITLIIISFIMINNRFHPLFKTLLLILGLMALISFNSRSALIICLCLFLYKFILYNVKPIFILFLGIFVYVLFFSDLILFVQQNSFFFGRLSISNNLKDDSSQTRLFSYFYFWNSRWSFQDIIFGGRIIKLLGTDYTLENGILLNITWWGWVIGLLKVILELLISFFCLKKYNIKDKLIILIACWGTSFSNNNSFYTFVFAFFIFSFISFDPLTNKQNSNFTF
jgi:hypothetical protein